MSFGKIAVCLMLAGILGGAGCRHVASESKAPATVKEQLDSQGGATAAPAVTETKEGEAKPAEGETKPAEPAADETKEGEAKPAPGAEEKE